MDGEVRRLRVRRQRRFGAGRAGMTLALLRAPLREEKQWPS